MCLGSWRKPGRGGGRNGVGARLGRLFGGKRLSPDLIIVVQVGVLLVVLIVIVIVIVHSSTLCSQHHMSGYLYTTTMSHNLALAIVVVYDTLTLETKVESIEFCPSGAVAAYARIRAVRNSCAHSTKAARHKNTAQNSRTALSKTSTTLEPP